MKMSKRKIENPTVMLYAPTVSTLQKAVDEITAHSNVIKCTSSGDDRTGYHCQLVLDAPIEFVMGTWEMPQ